MATVRVTGKSGATYEFIDTMIGAGGMKDVYFSPDKSYVVAFFRGKVDPVGQQRLDRIVDKYRKGIFEAPGGEFWKDRFCWPIDVVVHDGRTGVVAPTYPKQYFFEHGATKNDFLKIQGKEKDGKWFASSKLRGKLDPQELGTWREYLRLSLSIARSVQRMHAAGLAHSDLSYKNVLVNPVTGDACLIDIDGLVVPGLFPPEVVGTPDFIAPEVIRTQHLPLHDNGRFLPSAHTDRHALAVLIYMYLFYRHPLQGGKIHSQDPTEDEEKKMGGGALFVEHPTDTSNRVNLKWLDDGEKFWGNPANVPYSAAGPHLKVLFERAFIDGLHDPTKRPIAADWETALIKTLDMIQPCSNTKCEGKWYVFDNTNKPQCPFCKTDYVGPLPVLDLYRTHDGKTFRPENHRIMVWDGQSLFPYHVDSLVVAGATMKPEHRKRVGYFQKVRGVWYLINENMPTLTNVSDPQKHVPIAIGEKVKLEEDLRLRLSTETSGRLIRVTLANVDRSKYGA